MCILISKHDVSLFYSFLGVMPAYSRLDNALAAKLVSFYPENKKYPTHQGWVLYFDPSTGCLKAVSYILCIKMHFNVHL